MPRSRMILLGVLVIGVRAAAAATNEKDAAPRALGVQMLAPHGTNFFSTCRFSHRSPDDPIVYPGVPGISHAHDFFGNTSTNAHSTLKSLRAHGTTCNRAADTAAYWVPSLYQRGALIEPIQTIVYYRIRAVGAIHPFPPGLKIVAGNPHASAPQPTTMVFWDCGYPPGPIEPSAAIPRCHKPRVPHRMLRPLHKSAGRLLLNVNFPDCWDGRRLDSADHRSHMAYSTNKRCPASHPVKVPSLRLTVVYPIRGGPALALASGGVYSGHADFFNGWDQAELARLVSACAAEKRHCSRPSQ